MYDNFAVSLPVPPSRTWVAVPPTTVRSTTSFLLLPVIVWTATPCAVTVVGVAVLAISVNGPAWAAALTVAVFTCNVAVPVPVRSRPSVYAASPPLITNVVAFTLATFRSASFEPASVRSALAVIVTVSTAAFVTRVASTSSSVPVSPSMNVILSSSPVSSARETVNVPL